MQYKSLLTLRFLLGGLFFVLFAMSYWHALAYHQFLKSPIKWPDRSKPLNIASGQSLNQLAVKWQATEVIEHALYLKIFARLNPKYRNIKTGEYQIEVDETVQSLLDKLVAGKVIQYRLTLVEGHTIYQLLDSLKVAPNIVYDLPESHDAIITMLDLPIQHLEGWFLPETYRFTKGEQASKILKRAFNAMRETLASAWAGRQDGLPLETPYQALILASIIEKETGLASEREAIAGVFTRRLEKGMRLQTDPTIIYGIGPSFNGDITYKDLRTPTPYNTYVIKGLPPTPIAMPGKASIEAAVNPQAGETLYFVATGDGGHYFSKTLKEHNQAVRKYQLRKE